MPFSLSDVFAIIIFGIFIAFWLADIILPAVWNKTYFTIGIPIFTLTIPVDINHLNIPPQDVLEGKLQDIGITTVIFKEFNANMFGFREKSDPPTWARKPPLMHGLLIFDNNGNQVIVKGFTNWSLIGVILIWLCEVIVILFYSPTIALVFLVFFLLLIGISSISYSNQASQFGKIAAVAAQSWSKTRSNHANGA